MTTNRAFIASSLTIALLGAAATANAQNADPEVAGSPPPAETAPPTAAAPAPAPPPTAMAAPAAAQVTDQPGVSISARLAYAVPMGSVQQNDDLSSAISAGVPIVVEGAYRINRNISVGLYGQYGLLFTKNCPAGATCSATDYRFGVEGIYNMRSSAPIDPWVGLGVGYEWLTAKASDNYVSGSNTFSGLELATLQAGGNFAASPGVEVGPFVSLSISKYGSASMGGDITNTAYHQWLQLGFRGTFNL